MIDTRVGNMENSQSNLQISLEDIQNITNKKVSKGDFEIYQFHASKMNATKEDISKLEKSFKLFVRTDEFGVTQTNIHHIEKSLRDDYLSKTKLSDLLKKLKQEIMSEMQESQKGLELKISEEIDRQRSCIKENESNIAAFNQKIYTIYSKIGEVKDKLEEKATKKDIEDIYKEMEKYCRFQHVKDLEFKVMPKITNFADSISDFQTKLDQTDSIIQRFDEILLTKASKVTLESFRDQLHVFATREQAEANLQRIKKVDDKVKKMILQTNENLNSVEKEISKTLNNSISTIASKVLKEVQFKANMQKFTIEELDGMLQGKVGNAEFANALETKANKNDTTTAMNSIEILHKQNQNICGIIMEALKQAADSFLNTDESEKSLYEKRVQLHKQALRVSKWIDMFTPNDISILEKEYSNLKSMIDFKNRTFNINKKFKRNLSNSDHLANRKNKVFRDKDIQLILNRGATNKSNESIKKRVNTEVDEDAETLYALPSVKNANRSVIMNSRVTPKTQRNIANSIQINKKKLFQIQKRKQVFRNHKRNVSFDEAVRDESPAKINQII
ncbi:unnamed protein product [Moneuplotes crassus]|uniref:Uncharacterized protein n=1 Tax=Euplotes crassus TaxID=5936 RepID=A0AAD1Y1Z2_EUPCR|nr:unnamed protein product [Moneuplotes crassus]